MCHSFSQTTILDGRIDYIYMCVCVCINVSESVCQYVCTERERERERERELLGVLYCVIIEAFSIVKFSRRKSKIYCFWIVTIILTI